MLRDVQQRDAASLAPVDGDGHERIVLTPTPSHDTGDQGYDLVSMSSVPSRALPRPKTRSRVHTLTATKALFAACLVLAASVRATVVSLLYLFAFCCSIAQWSFESRALALLTLFVALVACVGHGAIQSIDGRRHSGDAASVAAVLGFSSTHRTVLEYLQAIGVDGLVLVSSCVHYWSVRRARRKRLSMEKQKQDTSQQHLDLFEMGVQFVTAGEPERNRSCSTLRVVELLTALLLFLTSVSVPAFASGVLYLVLVGRLIVYTVCVRKVTVQELVARESSASFTSCFLGPVVTNVLLGCCLVIVLSWYVFHLDPLTNDVTARTVAKYAGFANFRDRGVQWQYFLFAGFLFLLFVSCAKLRSLHHAAAIQDKAGCARSRASGYWNNDTMAADFGSVNSSAAQALLSRRRTESDDIQKLLSKQSIVVRAFARDGGLLLGSAAAIVWCVSYPSYLSAPLLGLAFVTIAVFGLLSSSIFMWLFIAYGTLVVLAEYTSNLTINFVPGDLSAYGLRVFDYPILHIGAHTLCAVFMFLSIRTQWHYRDVLRESRKRRNRTKRADVDNDVDNGDEVVQDRASYANFVRLAKLRRQLQQGWRPAVHVWILDARQFVVLHLDVLVLATILIVTLSTDVSFLQVGYLVLAALLMLFFKQRRRFWRVLLLYALGACFAVFIWNVECTGNSGLELFGLQCYCPDMRTWRSLWPTLFSAQLLIIFQLVFQLVIYVTNSEAIEEHVETKEHVRQKPVFFVSRLAVEIDNCFRICGVLFCYAGFIVVAVQFETGPTTLSTTVIGGVQLVLFIVTFGYQLVTFAPRTSMVLKLLWSLALLIEVTILVVRYIYQFEQVSSYMELHLFTPSFVSAQDFGLEYHASTGGISDVFVYLLPTSVLTGLCFWQLSSMRKDIMPYDFFSADRSRAAHWICVCMETARYLLISFSAIALVIVTMWVALDQIGFDGWLYVLTLIGGRALSGAWTPLWLPLFWLAALSMLLKYVIQVSVFSIAQSGTGNSNVLPGSGENSDWVGMIRLNDRYGGNVGKSALWDLLSGDFLIIFMCLLQRMAQYVDSSSSIRHIFELGESTMRFEEQYASYIAKNADVYDRTSSCEVVDDSDHNDRARASTHDNDGALSPVSKRHFEIEQDSRRLNPAPQSPSFSDDKTFISCLRRFGTTYASTASVNVVMLLLTVSCFVHQDVIAIMYLLVVRSMMFAYPSTVCERWWALAWLLSVVVVLEYSIMLWLPPFLNVKMEETFPWQKMSNTYEIWLVPSNQHKWAAMADFVALMGVYILPGIEKTEKLTEDEDKKDVVDETAFVHKSNDGGGFIGESAESTGSIRPVISSEVTMYIMLTRKHAWYFLEHAFLINWLPLLLFLVFVFGAKHGGVVSVAYLLGALMMLYRLDEAREPSNLWIQYMRKWNWAHLFVITIINVPTVYAALSECVIGTKASDDDSCMTVANLLGVDANKTPYGLIALFVLISIQCEIVAAPTYQIALAILASEQSSASIRREAIVRDFYRRRTEQWYIMKRDKNAAIQRLKMIVSKLVHKVEELMDIALGLHHNLPPMAPSKPVATDRTQNSATISWEKPAYSYHKIRYYRISRQQFPSLTLLGDFGDIVEISGDRSEARIEGLRPGTSYQFKVCAVSRLGEGPYSSASDPIATYSLNLSGTTTAGWMKYRREKLPAPRFDFLVSWMKARYLHRYVVLDSSHLVFYQDEERALMHRSRKHRKRLKTSFKWRDVTSLKLSDSKVQFDDVSPSLYCFEIVVHHPCRRGAMKYVFQSELSKEFNMFLSALAFAAPRDSLDDSIINCLKDRQLPNPMDTKLPHCGGEVEANYDESKSEWSSVTGDGSTLGDPEDEEFDDKSAFVWRIPSYRLLYNIQNAGFKLETTPYEEDDFHEPSLLEIAQLAINGARSESASICCLALVICFTVQADFLNMVFVVSAFAILLVENPRPSPLIWTHLLAYSCCIIGLRYVFQLSVFCTGMTNRGYFYPSVEPYCTTATDAATNARSIQPMVLLGLYKFDGIAIANVTSVYDGLQWDFYVMLLLLWHRRELRMQGLWSEAYSGDDVDDQASSRYKSELMRELRSSFPSSQDSIDDAFSYDGPVNSKKLKQAKSLRSHESTSPRSSKHLLTARRASMGVSAACVNNSELCNEVATQVIEEMLEQEKLEADQKSASTAAFDDTVARSPSSRRSNECSGLSPRSPSMGEDIVVSKQIEMDANASEHGFHAGAKKSWLAERFPKVHAYFQTVICEPPAQWDKDIQVAITGEKPGRDFYTASLSVLLLSSIYAVIFYKELGEADSSDTSVADADSRVSSSSLLSGNLVLLVLTELIFIVWDRVAYVCSSLQSKVILQYSYTFVLHLAVWYLLPSVSNIYFQQRPALVAFYLFQCVYLWLGALQIRCGYPAYLGSRYNYAKATSVTAISETLFGLMMLAPFLFEMRALLDYLCMKTSLSWQHWILLEDTVAHVFGVKGIMKSRVEAADILQGKNRQPMKTKMMSAGVMLLFLLICLVGPLAMFSSINPSTTANNVTLTTVTFGIEDEKETMNELYSSSDSNSPSCEVDLNTDSASTQCIEFDVFSNNMWGLSPPRMDLLVTQLQSTKTLKWAITFAFTRPGPTDRKVITAKYSTRVTDEHRNALIPMIKQTLTDDESTTLPSVQIDDLLPAVVQLTASNGVLRRSTEMRSVTISKHSLGGSTWWNIEPIKSSRGSNYCSATYPFCIVAVSDRIVQGLTTLGISSYGLTAVYVFVVVTVGSAVKVFFRGKLFRIQYDELPDPGDVLELVEGIYIARHEQYVGHLKDEVRLFETLVRVLRSPETLLKVTGVNVIHIPTAKEKLD
ncbi:unnamed protein product [Hyaloperonospora brassicae]|uniref:Fibronectin type-III domain-containing protein n=1 Tax=Hyaloperonospora brassicae TaxID=162125 RepID=A0AAV0U5D9_HYABA|nr:unnamed protein product [Hyaloperonospora brassicae]